VPDALVDAAVVCLAAVHAPAAASAGSGDPEAFPRAALALLHGCQAKAAHFAGCQEAKAAAGAPDAGDEEDEVGRSCQFHVHNRCVCVTAVARRSGCE